MSIPSPRFDEPLAEERDGFKFRSGRLALDFAATLAARLKPEPRELLATPADLDRWLRAAGLGSAAEATPDALSSARELREALYRLAMACIREVPFPTDDRDLVNRWAARSHSALQLGRQPGEADTAAEPWGPEPSLATVARNGVALYSSAESARIRQCAACSILFVDASRARRRRWCSMAACGNKAKVASHRRKQRGSREA
ncbi:MAG: ABATE domain-containing protein [Acidobacteriota bacterium]